MTRFFVPILLWLFSVGAGQTAPARIYVNAKASGNQTGTSWTDARRDIRSALVAVKKGEEIWVARGRYQEGEELRITVDDVRVYGGFSGTETSLSQRDLAGSATVVDGGHAHRVFHIAANNVILNGLTVSRGKERSGAGVYNAGNGFTIQHCVLRDCRVEGDWAQGGGILTDRPMRVLDCVIEGNHNVFQFNSNGAGSGIVFNSEGTLHVSNTVFRGNHTGQWNSGTHWHGAGGAILMLKGELDATHCIFDGNRTDHSKGRHGGAIFGGTLRITHCTFYGNSTPQSGGAIYTEGHVAVTNSIFWGNTCGPGQARDLHAGSADIGHTCLSGTGTDSIIISGKRVQHAIITRDPLFVNPADHDFHLKSVEGRWDPSRGGWLADGPTSPCIDRGEPGSTCEREPAPNGGRANLGAYGNTAYASLSEPGVKPVIENRTPARFDRSRLAFAVELVEGQWADGTVYWGTKDGGTNASSWQHASPFPDSLQQGQVARVEPSDLASNTTYYYRGYATNAAGDGWTPAASFRTGDILRGSPDPGVIHVDASNTSKRQDGSCWAYAYRDLATAWSRIEGETNTLWVAAGTYSYGKTLQAKLPALSIYGGFTSEETAPKQRDLAKNTTRLIGYQGEDRRQAYRLLEVSGAHVTLDGLTFLGGQTLHNGDGGGAVKSQADDLKILNCTFSTNLAACTHAKGGALFVSGDALISHCEFRNNVSGTQPQGQGDGGAIYFEKDGGRLAVSNSVFYANRCLSAHLTRPKKGGAIYADGGPDGRVQIDYCTFFANKAGSDRGAIAVLSGDLDVSHSIFWANKHAEKIAGYGREIWLGGKATLQIGYCNVDTNEIAGPGTRTLGPGLDYLDPVFATTEPPPDLHLQSQFGRWTPDGFVNDVMTSPCIGLGAYGNTPRASRRTW